MLRGTVTETGYGSQDGVAMLGWRLVALGTAVVPTVLTIVTGPHSGNYAGFADRPVDPAVLNAYNSWQSLVEAAVPALIVAVAWLFRGRARRPATTAAAALLVLLAIVAVVGGIARDQLPYPMPAVPVAVAWLYVPCFAASAVALWFCRRSAPATGHRVV